MCGIRQLDDFLARYATQYAKRNLARTYVAVRDQESRVLGYYCLSCGGVPFENWPSTAVKRLPEHPVPVALLGRLAVDQSVRGQGLGGHLLRDALIRCRQTSEQIGVFAVIVDAIDENVIRFYKHYGFEAFTDQPDKLFLPIRSVESL